MPKIKAVEKLTITFLVDNSIEWMTKLPPGFILEVPLHLTHPDVPIDALTGVPFVDLENYCCGAHGFSALIETEVEGEESRLTLFDTGPDSRSIIRNVQALRIPVERIERIVLSHWHADHSGGMLALLRHRAASVLSTAAAAPPCVVDLHPDRPLARGIAPVSAGGRVVGRLPDDPHFAALEAAGARVETHAVGHAVAGGAVWVSGEIPRVTHFEGGLPSGVRWVEREGEATGKWVPEEDVMDERYAAIDVLGKGLVIFSSCSHAGIVNVVKDAINTFARPVYMIIGGLHLAGTELVERIPPTVDFLASKMRPSPTYVLPMHCTGFAAKVALEDALGEGCVPAGVGHRIIVEGSAEAEKRLFAATYSQ
ncbi:beta-lactamase-like protein [Epithele typhae]|uniref:beta-lactamase-like protein n=1 Tax=Epithele typhae TaxID=378194 RepID=UPI0020084395|nr:beta-lactamase-like protein [Epithele typhae]KAH9940423.1 beta-lactamase-like protein [Epithele typhae]